MRKKDSIKGRMEDRWHIRMGEKCHTYVLVKNIVTLPSWEENANFEMKEELESMSLRCLKGQHLTRRLFGQFNKIKNWIDFQIVIFFE